MSVVDATRAFGTPLRVRLIRHYLDQPGSQKAAAERLGISTSLVQVNTRILVEIGLVVRDAQSFTVDATRLEELRAALLDYLEPPADEALAHR